MSLSPGAGADYLTGHGSQGNSWNAQKNNFGPQIGFAWSPAPFHEFTIVVSAAVMGLNYNQEEIAISANINAITPG